MSMPVFTEDSGEGRGPFCKSSPAVPAGSGDGDVSRSQVPGLHHPIRCGVLRGTDRADESVY